MREELQEMYDILEKTLHKQFKDGIEHCNKDELDCGIDMLHDLAETDYYKSVTDAMHKGKKDWNADKPEQITLDMYSDKGDKNVKWYHSRDDYMMNKDKGINTRVEHLGKYLDELAEDIMDMTKDMMIEEKNLVKQKLMSLTSKM